jgi:hypothetical protein
MPQRAHTLHSYSSASRQFGIRRGVGASPRVSLSELRKSLLKLALQKLTRLETSKGSDIPEAN